MYKHNAYNHAGRAQELQLIFISNLRMWIKCDLCHINNGVVVARRAGLRISKAFYSLSRVYTDMCEMYHSFQTRTRI